MNSTQNSHSLKASLLQYYYTQAPKTPKEKEHIQKQNSLTFRHRASYI
jgi:hypothetical protein